MGLPLYRHSTSLQSSGLSSHGRLGSDSPIMVFFIALSVQLLNGKRNYLTAEHAGSAGKKCIRCNLGRISIVALLSLAPGFSRVNPAITGNKTRFNGLSLGVEAVETASRWFANVITGLKPGANENIPPFAHNF